MKAREQLPTRDQIFAISDKDALFELRDRVEWNRKKIETDLEFGDGDDDWAARARTALTAHKICHGNIERRLQQITKQAQPAPGPSKSETKTARHLAAAERAQQEAEARRAKAEQAKVAQQERVAAILERTSWLSYFHKAAVRMLDAETLEKLIDAAERDYAGRVKHEIRAAA